MKKGNDLIETLKDEYILLTIDPSLQCTGYSILMVDNNGEKNINNKHVKIIEYGMIPTKGLSIGQELMLFEKIISEVIEKYNPDYITSEQMFAGNNRNTGMKLGYIHGILQLLAAKNYLNVVYYSVLTAKSTTLDGLKMKKDDGSKKTGDEMKQEVAEKIFEIFGKESFQKEFTNDVTDAISIGVTFIKKDGKEIEKVKKKRKTAKKKNTKK